MRSCIDFIRRAGPQKEEEEAGASADTVRVEPAEMGEAAATEMDSPLVQASIVVLSHCLSVCARGGAAPSDTKAMLAVVSPTDLAQVLIDIVAEAKGNTGQLAAQCVRYMVDLACGAGVDKVSLLEPKPLQRILGQVMGSISKQIGTRLGTLDARGRLLNLCQTLVENTPMCLEAVIMQGVLPVLLMMPAPFKATVIDEILPVVLAYAEQHNERLRAMLQLGPSDATDEGAPLLQPIDPQQAANIRYVLKYAVSPAGLACIKASQGKQA